MVRPPAPARSKLTTARAGGSARRRHTVGGSAASVSSRFACVLLAYLVLIAGVFALARVHLSDGGAASAATDARHPAFRRFFGGRSGGARAVAAAAAAAHSPLSLPAVDAAPRLVAAPAAAASAAAATSPAAAAAAAWVASIQREASWAGARAQRPLSSVAAPAPDSAFAVAWAAYRAMHAAKTRGGPEAAALRGAIIVQPVGQLGNRVMAIAAAFVLGLLTQRAVYANFAAGYYAPASALFADAGLVWEAADAPSKALDGGCARTLALAEAQSSDAELSYLLCEDDSAAAPGSGAGADTVCVVSNQYFAPLLARNPAYAARLAALFPQDGDMFGLIARELFRPSAEVAAMRDAYKAEVGWADTYVVGLQLRTGGDFTDRGFAQPDWDLTLRVANALLPAAPAAAAPRGAAFFVATDIEWSRDAALVQLARNDTRVLEYGEFLRSNTPRGCQQALVDILLLAEANDLATTAWSTFGYMAAGYTGHRAALITLLAEPPAALLPAHEELAAAGRATFMGVVMHDDRRSGAARLPTAEPCYHFVRRGGARARERERDDVPAPLVDPHGRARPHYASTFFPPPRAQLAFNAIAITKASCYRAASDLAGRPLLEAWMRDGRYC